MSVTNGQTANAATFNAAFAGITDDNTLTGIQNLNSGAAASGSQITNAQREFNAIDSVLGLAVGQIKTYLFTWASDVIGVANDTVKARIEAIVAAMFWRAGAQTLGNGVSSIAIVFSGAAFADTTYAVLHTFQNTVDSTPIFIQGMVTAKSTTGFTLTFNAPTDTANYVLSWQARKAN